MRSFQGVVQEGTRRGRVLGYPTINLSLDDLDVSGIYVARVYLKDGNPYPAAVFADPVRGVIEAHLLNFQDDLYGLDVRIELHEKIRDSKQFENDAGLKTAIAEDIAKVREYFKN